LKNRKQTFALTGKKHKNAIKRIFFAFHSFSVRRKQKLKIVIASHYYPLSVR